MPRLRPLLRRSIYRIDYMRINVRESIAHRPELDVKAYTPILYKLLLSELIEPIDEAYMSDIDCFTYGDDTIVISIEEWMDSNVFQQLQRYCNLNSLSNSFSVSSTIVM